MEPVGSPRTPTAHPAVVWVSTQHATESLALSPGEGPLAISARCYFGKFAKAAVSCLLELQAMVASSYPGGLARALPWSLKLLFMRPQLSKLSEVHGLVSPLALSAPLPTARTGQETWPRSEQREADHLLLFPFILLRGLGPLHSDSVSLSRVWGGCTSLARNPRWL